MKPRAKRLPLSVAPLSNTRLINEQSTPKKHQSSSFRAEETCVEKERAKRLESLATKNEIESNRFRRRPRQLRFFALFAPGHLCKWVPFITAKWQDCDIAKWGQQMRWGISNPLNKEIKICKSAKYVYYNLLKV